MADGDLKAASDESVNSDSNDAPRWQRAYERSLREKVPVACHIVLDALYHGELRPLAAYLATTDGPIAPQLRRQLVNMIYGHKGSHVLVAQRNPKLESRQRTRQELFAESALVRKIAFFIAENGGFDRGHGKRIYPMAVEKFGKSESWIRSKLTASHKELAIRRVAGLKRTKIPD